MYRSIKSSQLIKTLYILLPNKPVPWNTIATSLKKTSRHAAITAQIPIPTIAYRQTLAPIAE